MDQLWVKYSNGRFGFSVQKKIYLSVGGKADGEFYKEAWEKLGDRVGWKVKRNWIHHSDVVFNASAPEGHLPSCILFTLGGLAVYGASLYKYVAFLASRLVKCNI
ncbi:GUN4 domain-containing protein [Nostoc sp. TCL240-02]|uniref:GUN4 domain-containing protein n=1 Tax=Nostoc sp. TCL240-02 TaxID=2572090 RepID=UPI0020C6670A|nr:GUN4 domain-containing protein [Nostoc sp. TCL240-02]